MQCASTVYATAVLSDTQVDCVRMADWIPLVFGFEAQPTLCDICILPHEVIPNSGHRRRLLEMTVGVKFPFPFSSLRSHPNRFPCHTPLLPLFPPVRPFPISLTSTP